jgi:glycogen synthase
MCSLVKEKGLDFVIDAIETIGALGGILIVVGVGDPYY